MSSIVTIGLLGVMPSTAENNEDDSDSVGMSAKGYVCTYYEEKGDGRTKLTYDSKGNEIYREYSNGNSQIHKYTYYDNGKIKTEYAESNNGWWNKISYDKMGKQTYWMSSDGYWEKAKYDTHGNCTFYQDSDGNSYTQKYTYFSNGKIKTEDLKYSNGGWYKYTYNENGNMINSDDDIEGPIEYTYDAYGNEISRKHIKSGYISTRTYTYYENGKVKTEYCKDSYGYWSKSTYDTMGNLTYSIDSDGIWTEYKYDSKGNKTYFEDNEGNWDKYTYDSKGNIIYFKTKFDSEIGWMKYSYDSKGNMISGKGNGGYWEKAKYAKIGSKKSMKPISSIRSSSAVKKDKKKADNAMKKAEITKLSIKSKSKNIKISFKKLKKAWGYQAQVSKNKSFKKKVINKKYRTNKINIKNKKIKKNKTYYIRVRAYASYRDKNGKAVKIYSKWNKDIKKIKVK